jgi:hypothetical protein
MDLGALAAIIILSFIGFIILLALVAKASWSCWEIHAQDIIGLSFVLGVLLLFVGLLMLGMMGLVSLSGVISDREIVMVWLGGILSLVGGSLTILAFFLAWIDYGKRYNVQFEPSTRREAAT